MNEEIRKTIAKSLETDEKLVDQMPFLLQDLWALGSAVEQILKLVESVKFPESSKTVLDLGCGKGAVSIQIAKKFGCQIVGIDGMREFIDDAERMAEKYKVSSMCKFLHGDLHDFVKTPNEFDLVILASLGGILGNNIKTVQTLRSQVKPGGFIIIDDGYIKDGSRSTRNGYEHYRSFKDTEKELTAFGDRIVKTISTQQESIEINEFYTKNLKNRVSELSHQLPHLKTELINYYNMQISECEFLEKNVEGIAWLLQKK